MWGLIDSLSPIFFVDLQLQKSELHIAENRKILNFITQPKLQNCLILIAKTDNSSFEQKLFKAADKLRKNIDAAEYKHVVLGLIFLKYISESFTELYKKLEADEWSDPEDRDEYIAENVFFVPPLARWSHIHAQAKLPSVGQTIDEAMDAIEKENDLKIDRGG